MLTPPWFRSGSVVAALLALVVACSAAGSSEPCEADEDCESGTCALNGRCAPGECSCTGAECGTIQDSCGEGSLCVAGRAPYELGYNRCLQPCDASKGCPSDQNCDNRFCREGAPPFPLRWGNLPRTSPCAPRVPCEYIVVAPEGIEVEGYTWAFGGAPEVETKDPTTKFTYDVAGTFDVVVRAQARSGATAVLRAAEVLCVGTFGSLCEAQGSPCCEGICSAAGLCR